MASPNVSEIITTTLESRSGVLADNFSKNTALLLRLKEKDNIVPVSGGYEIREEIAYTENTTVQSYSGYEEFDISPQDVFTSATFPWAQYVVSVSISGLEELMNSGKEAKIDLISARIDNAEKSLLNRMSTDLYLDGTGNSGKNLLGLGAAIPDNPATGVYASINRATWSFWRSQKFAAVADGSAAISSSTIVPHMTRTFIKCVRGREKPDLVVFDDVFFTTFVASFEGKQYVTDTKMAEAGFLNVKFMGADVVLDGGFGGAATASHGWFLNTNYIRLRPHKDRDMKSLGKRNSVNQDATVEAIAWAGNLTCRNCALQGVLIA